MELAASILFGEKYKVFEAKTAPTINGEQFYEQIPLGRPLGKPRVFIPLVMLGLEIKGNMDVENLFYDGTFLLLQN